MQIVIDIPNDFYERVNNDGCMSYTDAEVVVNAFYCGTPLPKGHGRLIDESILREDMERAYKFANELVALGFAESFLEHAPTIIEADKEAAEEVEE